MVAQIRYIRPPSVGLTHDDWYEEALCRGLPPKLFELQDFDVVERGEQEERIAEGLKVCSGCPVRAACKDGSSELDRYWTTRGGQPPEGLFEDAALPALGRIAKNGRGGRVAQELCRKGHKDWGTRKDGKRFCISCKRAADRVESQSDA